MQLHVRLPAAESLRTSKPTPNAHPMLHLHRGQGKLGHLRCSKELLNHKQHQTALPKLQTSASSSRVRFSLCRLLLKTLFSFPAQPDSSAVPAHTRLPPHGSCPGLAGSGAYRHEGPKISATRATNHRNPTNGYPNHKHFESSWQEGPILDTTSDSPKS